MNSYITVSIIKNLRDRDHTRNKSEVSNARTNHKMAKIRTRRVTAKDLRIYLVLLASKLTILKQRNNRPKYEIIMSLRLKYKMIRPAFKLINRLIRLMVVI